MTKIIFSLPDNLIARMKTSIPVDERNHVLIRLLEQEIAMREQTIYQHALLLEANKELRDEMIKWDNNFIDDGLDE